MALGILLEDSDYNLHTIACLIIDPWLFLQVATTLCDPVHLPFCTVQKACTEMATLACCLQDLFLLARLGPAVPP